LLLDWTVCNRSGAVTADHLRFDVNLVEPDLGTHEFVFLPGGPATRHL
jgi:cyclohexyl-isocyanide hydratase